MNTATIPFFFRAVEPDSPIAFFSPGSNRGQPMAVIIEGGSMAKLIRPTQLEKKTVIRQFAI